ncbi:MAG: ribosome assembly RNA-binding protein YhbY [Deltaproteobacteria bacterium]|jgi:RNA-binding protein|nr:ribosome assembly RNA-binding protein YhbY [Deltaproteobacteria bacterium]
MKSYQKKHLRGLAHGLKPTVFVGQKGVVPSVVKALDKALDRHELIKVKFIEFKEKDRKEAIVKVLERESGSELVGMVGHVAILYRMQKDPEKRKIEVPERKQGRE